MSILRVVFFLVWGLQLAASQQLPLVVPETRFDWGQVFSDEPAEHAFTIRNDGNVPVAIARVDLTPPLSIKSMPAVKRSNAMRKRGGKNKGESAE